MSGSQSVVEKSFRERRDILHKAFVLVEGEFAFAQYGNTSELEEIQILLDESMKASCEGLMVKMLDTQESGYEPSKRSRNWLKVKKDYLSGVGDSLDLVVLGAYYGKGKRTSVYGAFLLACYSTGKQIYETVCNIGTGFSEAMLESLHAKLSQHTIDKPKPFYAHSTVPKDQPDVWFEPASSGRSRPPISPSARATRPAPIPSTIPPAAASVCASPASSRRGRIRRPRRRRRVAWSSRCIRSRRV